MTLEALSSGVFYFNLPCYFKRMKVTQVPLQKIIPYALNNKIHTPAAIDKMAATIKEFGFLVPVLLSLDNVIIAGHKRVLAAQKLGMDTIPGVYADNLTAAQIRALRIIDNKITQDSDFDLENVKCEIDALSLEDFRLDDFIEPFDFDDCVNREEKVQDDCGGDGVISCPNCGHMFKP